MDKQQIKNKNQIKVGDIIVEMVYSDEERNIEKCIKELLNNDNRNL